MTTMPAVVPAPRSQSNPASELTCSRSGVRPATWGRANSMALTSRLLSTGANAGAAKRRRAFSSAVKSAVSP
jgi:hypothetical protein